MLADECCAPDCELHSEPDYPVPLCRKHLMQVIRCFQEQLVTFQQDNPLLIEALRGREDAEERLRRTRRYNAKAKHVVYFIRFGDRVKIGTSGDVKRRLEGLPYDEVIGTIPGDATVERLWHTVWADQRITGEWFHATPELLSAIRQAVAEAA